MKPARIIEQISQDLNDQEPGYEYARWSYDQLAVFVQEALDYVAEALKDEFIERVVVSLEPGDVWQDACECNEIIRILGETTADGSRILRRLRRVEDDESLLWQGEGAKRCAYGAAYAMESYTIDATTGDTFRIYPPLPAYALPRYVLLECYVPPSVEADSDIPQKVAVCAKQWALFRALMIDTENNEAVFTVAKEHRDTFYKLVADLRALKEMELRNGNGSSARPAQNGSSD